jgi:hypothetical protein
VRRGLGGVFGGGTEYLPHYFLGEALFNLKDCAGAVAAWSISEQQGAVRTRSEYVAVMQKGYAACAASGVLLNPQYLPLLSRTREAVTNITALAAAIAANIEKHPELLRNDLRTQYDRARVELQNAHNLLAVATRTRLERDFLETGATADRAGALLQTVDAQFRSLLDAIATADSLYTEVERILSDGDAHLQALDAKRSIVASRPSLTAARQQASDGLSRVRSQLAGAKGNVAALKAVRGQAEEALQRFKVLGAEVARIDKEDRDSRLRSLAAAAAQAYALVVDGFATVEQRTTQKPDSMTPDMSAQRETLAKEGETLRRRYEAAQRGQSAAALQDVARLAVELRAKLDDLIVRFPDVTIIDRGIRPELAEGARLFFAGDYPQAIATLDLSRLTNVGYQEHVHLFRAAAFHALFVRGGAKDAALRQQAVTEVEQVKRLKPDLTPDSRSFGPTFLTFFTAVPPTPASTPSPPQQ